MLTKRALNCLPVNQEARIGCFNDTKKINNNNNNDNNNINNNNINNNINNSNNNCHQKRGAVCQNHLMDQIQNVIRILEICVGLS